MRSVLRSDGLLHPFDMEASTNYPIHARLEAIVAIGRLEESLTGAIDPGLLPKNWST